MNVRSVARPGDSSRRSFFVTFVPIVVMYSSANLSTTNRRIRLVFPTAPSPRSNIFRLIRSSTIARSLHSGGPLITLPGSMSAVRTEGVSEGGDGVALLLRVLFDGRSECRDSRSSGGVSVRDAGPFLGQSERSGRESDRGARDPRPDRCLDERRLYPEPAKRFEDTRIRSLRPKSGEPQFLRGPFVGGVEGK